MAHFVGDFNEKQLIEKADKIAVMEAQEKYGEGYTKTKIIKKNGSRYLRIWTLSLDEYLHEPFDLDRMAKDTLRHMTAKEKKEFAKVMQGI